MILVSWFVPARMESKRVVELLQIFSMSIENKAKADLLSEM